MADIPTAQYGGEKLQTGSGVNLPLNLTSGAAENKVRLGQTIAGLTQPLAKIGAQLTKAENEARGYDFQAAYHAAVKEHEIAMVETQDPEVVAAGVESVKKRMTERIDKEPSPVVRRSMRQFFDANFGTFALQEKKREFGLKGSKIYGQTENSIQDIITYDYSAESKALGKDKKVIQMFAIKRILETRVEAGVLRPDQVQDELDKYSKQIDAYDREVAKVNFETAMTDAGISIIRGGGTREQAYEAIDDVAGDLELAKQYGLSLDDITQQVSKAQTLVNHEVVRRKRAEETARNEGATEAIRILDAAGTDQAQEDVTLDTFLQLLPGDPALAKSYSDSYNNLLAAQARGDNIYTDEPAYSYLYDRILEVKMGRVDKGEVMDEIRLAYAPTVGKPLLHRDDYRKLANKLSEDQADFVAKMESETKQWAGRLFLNGVTEETDFLGLLLAWNAGADEKARAAKVRRNAYVAMDQFMKEWNQAAESWRVQHGTDWDKEHAIAARNTIYWTSYAHLTPDDQFSKFEQPRLNTGEKLRLGKLSLQEARRTGEPTTDIDKYIFDLETRFDLEGGEQGPALDDNFKKLMLNKDKPVSQDAVVGVMQGLVNAGRIEDAQALRDKYESQF